MNSDSTGYLVFILSISGLGLLFSISRLFYAKRIGYPSFLFHLLIFLLSLFIFYLGLAPAGIYLKFPHFWRLFTALGYLCVPLLFLFFRVILTNRQQFKRTDLWVGLPALIHLLNMFPFILSGTESKLEAVRAVMNDGDALVMEIEGFLLPGLNSWLKAFVTMSVVTGQLLLLTGEAHHFRKGDGSREGRDRRLYAWLWMLTISLAISMFLILLQCLFDIIPDWSLLQIILFAYTYNLLFFLLSLFFFPDLLKGFKHPIAASDLFF
jgi:hypothetical protein